MHLLHLLDIHLSRATAWCPDNFYCDFIKIFDNPLLNDIGVMTKGLVVNKHNN